MPRGDRVWLTSDKVPVEAPLLGDPPPVQPPLRRPAPRRRPPELGRAPPGTRRRADGAAGAAAATAKSGRRASPARLAVARGGGARRCARVGTRGPSLMGLARAAQMHKSHTAPHDGAQNGSASTAARCGDPLRPHGGPRRGRGSAAKASDPRDGSSGTNPRPGKRAVSAAGQPYQAPTFSSSSRGWLLSGDVSQWKPAHGVDG
eukprot:scaffold942_cov366-Prasinococcus_capsulatus_cf.AAC.6